jgi:hypothetical protein
MPEIRYHIVFKGEILEGFDLMQVQSDLAHLFKKEMAQVEQLFTGRAVILKKNADVRTAESYRISMHKVGALCHLEPVKAEASVSEPTPVQTEEYTEQLFCPKCGYALKPDVPCPRCILAESRKELLPSGSKTKWMDHLKGSAKHWHLYLVLGLTAIFVIVMLIASPPMMNSDGLNNRVLMFESAERSDEPVHIAWDFSKNTTSEYWFEYGFEDMNLQKTEDEDGPGADPRRTLNISGDLRIESQGDRTAHVIQEESEVVGNIDLIPESFRPQTGMGNQIPRRLYAGLRESGQLNVPESSSFPFFAILFQLPDRVIAEGMSLSRIVNHRYIHSYRSRRMSGDARFMLIDYVKIDGRVCAHVLMTTLFEEEPHIPFADEYATVHCTLNLYWDLETRTGLCGRLILIGETQYSDAGYGGRYYVGRRTREIITYIHKDYLGACK